MLPSIQSKNCIAYLNRLGIDHRKQYSPLQLLEIIHLHHSFTIPFENLDIILGKKISLQFESLFDKVVLQQRGGYCYELNGLLYYMLREMEYDITLLSSRILFNTKQLFPKGHQFLLVNIANQRFIVDVGYRNGILLPLRFTLNEEQVQYSERFRLCSDNETIFTLQKFIKNQWEPLYSFTLESQLAVDFEPHNFYNSHSTDSIFTQIRLASKKTTYGSLTLIDYTLVEIRNAERIEKPITSKEDYQALMNNEFGIQLPINEWEKLSIGLN